MNTDALTALVMAVDGKKVRIVSIEAKNDLMCRITFEMNGHKVSKYVYLNRTVEEFHSFLRMKAKEAERDIVVLLAEEAEA